MVTSSIKFVTGDALKLQIHEIGFNLIEYFDIITATETNLIFCEKHWSENVVMMVTFYTACNQLFALIVTSTCIYIRKIIYQPK